MLLHFLLEGAGQGCLAGAVVGSALAGGSLVQAGVALVVALGCMARCAGARTLSGRSGLSTAVGLHGRTHRS